MQRTLHTSASVTSVETLTQYNLASRESSAIMLTKIHNEYQLNQMPPLTTEKQRELSKVLAISMRNKKTSSKSQ